MSKQIFTKPYLLTKGEKSAPIVVKSGFNKLTKQIEKICNENKSLVSLHIHPTFPVLINDSDKTSSFYFAIQSVGLDVVTGLSFLSSLQPESEYSNGIINRWQDHDLVIKQFLHWIELIKKHNEFNECNIFLDRLYLSLGVEINQEQPLDENTQRVIELVIDSTFDTLIELSVEITEQDLDEFAVQGNTGQIEKISTIDITPEEMLSKKELFSVIISGDYKAQESLRLLRNTLPSSQDSLNRITRALYVLYRKNTQKGKSFLIQLMKNLLRDLPIDVTGEVKKIVIKEAIMKLVHLLSSFFV
ncbi:MAG: hypothetical protein ACK481_04685 [Candidatus Melainabacteria bacterium]|jgi:hypothetical protein